MAKKSKTEANFTVSFGKKEAEVFKKASEAIKTDDTDKLAWGDYTFKITAGNMLYLDTLCKYAQMLDFVTQAQGEELLNIDGVVNEILDEALSKRVKELAKKHGFIDATTFCEELDDCKDGEDVTAKIRESERLAYVRAHERILAHIPLEDRQKNLFNEGK